MRKGKPDIVLIITAVMFGVALAVMISALICMAADVYIWHIFIPQAILLIAVTGLMFGVSLALHFYSVKAAKTDSIEQAENPSECDKRVKIARGFGVAALVCFYIALMCIVASRLCNGLADALTKLFSALAALASCAFAVISVVLSRRSAAEKASLFYLISIPIAFVIVCIAIMTVFAGVLFYIMLMSWGQWGLI